MGMGTGGGPGIKANINVTPLVDVVLVLLIIFMVVTPMLQRGKDVKLPQAHHAATDKKNAADPIIVSVTPDHAMWIERTQYDEQGFEDELRRTYAKTPNKRLLIKGDQSLVFKDVRNVMALARKAGAKSVALGVEELKQ
jgi:biopolymer transport protein TolR